MLQGETAILNHIFLILAIILLPPSCYAFDSIHVDEKSSLFSAVDKSLPVVSTSYISWGRNWKWADVQINPRYQRGTARSSFTGSIPDLGIDFTGTLNAAAKPPQFTWTYQWEGQKNIPDSNGFGVEFKFQLNSPTFSSPAKPPELLPGNRGWRWQTPDGGEMTVQFTPPLATIYFEKQRKDTIRALFFTAVERGKQQSVMTVSTEERVRLTGPDSLEYDDIDLSTWHPGSLPPDSSPVDLSFLNKHDRPAGKRGFVRARNGALEFADGAPARFWGANLQAYALFDTSDENIIRHARRIAQLGFNLVRIHHHDSQWVKPNIFKNPAADTKELSPASLKKLDRWIASLKEQGVYVWLDLHVGRNFTRNDGIENFDDLAKGKETAEARGFNYYNRSVREQMKAFNSAYLSHVNEYTGIAYKDDPAVVALLLTNENDLSHHFGNALLANKGVPLHHRLFAEDAKRFAKANNLSSDKTMRTWESGESKLYLNDAEHRFNVEMMDHLRKLGVKSLVATTNYWGGMGLSGLPSLTDGGIIDVHSYGGPGELTHNPRYYPGFLAWIGAAKVSGMPLSVSEWNIEQFPAADRFTAPLYTAGIASLQGWDALMLYGYSQAPLNGAAGGSSYSSFNDPAIMGVMPAAALLYRQNHVAPAKRLYELQPDRASFYFDAQNPERAKSIRTLLETSRFSVLPPPAPELPWLKNRESAEKNRTVIRDMNADFIPAGHNHVTSDTGELRRDWEKGIQTIDTPRSQVAAGALGGEVIRLGNATFSIRTKKAVVAVQSLDNRSIRKSGRILITFIARSRPAPTNKTVMLSEPVSGQITFAAPPGMRLYPVNRSGALDKPLRVKYAGGRYTTAFTSAAAHWYILQPGKETL